MADPQENLKELEKYLPRTVKEMPAWTYDIFQRLGADIAYVHTHKKTEVKEKMDSIYSGFKLLSIAASALEDVARNASKGAQDQDGLELAKSLTGLHKSADQGARAAREAAEAGVEANTVLLFMSLVAVADAMDTIFEQSTGMQVIVQITPLMTSTSD